MSKKSINNGIRFDAEKYAPTSWGQKKKVEEAFEYKTPSGQLCLIRRIGMDEVLEAGLFNDVDFFIKAMAEGENKKPAEPKDGDESMAVTILKNFSQLRETINKVLLRGVIAPVLHPVPNPPAEKNDDLIYVDDVEFEDAMDLFSEILDTEGLSTFREESETGVGNVPNEQALPEATE